MAALPARADVTGVTATPSTASVTQLAGATLNITWNVARTEVGGDGAGGPILRLVSSPSASLRLNGTSVATVAGTLSQNSGSLRDTDTEVVNISETLTLTPAQLKLLQGGTATIQRTFSDTQTSGSGTVTLNVTFPPSTDLDLTRIEMSFENDSRSEVVNEGDMLRAVAEVNFRHNGLLRGEWRLVEPAASLGGGTGRVLGIVREQLISSGQGTKRIVSPPLPTDQNGLYLLSFVVSDTDANIATPIIRYFVLEGRDDVAPMNIKTLGPANGVKLDTATIFSWNPLTGADAYELEILETDGEEPIAGKLVPAKDHKLSLSDMTIGHLTSGQMYEWRIRALSGGKVIGVSPRAKLIAP